MRKILVTALSLLLAAGTLFALPRPALAHCDNVNGPVVTAARHALEAGDVAHILPYVKAGSEAELKAAFDHALAVRKLGAEAKSLADTFFFETAVRLHRQGEGAAYTGLKYEDDYGPALHAAEESLVTGDLTDVEAVLTAAVREGLEERYHALLEAREHAALDGSVEANRERAEAELLYEIYVHEVYLAATGAAPHGEGGQTGGHEHGGGEAASGPTLVVNGTELEAVALDHDGILYLPLRVLVEALGGTVTWDPAHSAAEARLGGRSLTVHPGGPEAMIDGKPARLEHLPLEHGGATMVPAALLKSALGIETQTDHGKIEVQLHK